MQRVGRNGDEHALFDVDAFADDVAAALAFQSRRRRVQAQDLADEVIEVGTVGDRFATDSSLQDDDDDVGLPNLT